MLFVRCVVICDFIKLSMFMNIYKFVVYIVWWGFVFLVLRFNERIIKY